MPNAVAEAEPVVCTRAELIELKAKIFRILLEIGLDQITEKDIMLIRELSKDTETIKALRNSL